MKTKDELIGELHKAVLNNEINKVKELIGQGVAVNGIVRNDCVKVTVLHHAVYFDNMDIVQLLINNGADVNALDYHQETALHYAVGRENVAIATLLINNGADVNALNYHQETALHCAAERGNVAIATLLINNGADVNKLSCNKDTPLNIALCNKNWGIAKILMIEGADEFPIYLKYQKKIKEDQQKFEELYASAYLAEKLYTCGKAEALIDIKDVNIDKEIALARYQCLVKKGGIQLTFKENLDYLKQIELSDNVKKELNAIVESGKEYLALGAAEVLHSFYGLSIVPVKIVINFSLKAGQGLTAEGKKLLEHYIQLDNSLLCLLQKGFDYKGIADIFDKIDLVNEQIVRDHLPTLSELEYSKGYAVAGSLAGLLASAIPQSLKKEADHITAALNEASKNNPGVPQQILGEVAIVGNDNDVPVIGGGDYGSTVE